VYVYITFLCAPDFIESRDPYSSTTVTFKRPGQPGWGSPSE
jgi:hypothetical protein